MNNFFYKRALMLLALLLPFLETNTLIAQKTKGGGLLPANPLPKEPPTTLTFCQQYPEKCITTPCEPNRQPSSSNPTAPINNERLSRKNTFDWQTPNSISWLRPTGTQVIYSPFFQGDNTITGNFVWPNPDYKIEDGWELLKKDFGGLLGNENNPYQAVVNPYIALYNKYNGKLRIFMARGMTAEAYNMTFILTQNNNKSSLLDIANATMKAIDAPFTPVQLQAVSPIYDTEGKWFYADFQTIYDPCTCLYGNNKLNINVWRTQNSDISMTGTLEGKIISEAQKQMSSTSGNQYSFKELKQDGDKFVKAFGTIGSLFSDLDKQTQTDAATLKVSPQVKESITKLAKNTTSTLEWFSKLKGGLSSVPYLSQALSLIDLFTAGGGNSGPTKVQIQPMVINAGLKMSGKITTTTPYDAITIATPGSQMSSVPDKEVPHYTETMGIFNLLYTPKVATGVIGTEVWYPWWDWEGLYPENIDRVNYRLAEPLVYVLNPAAGLEVQDIQVSFISDIPYGYDEYNSFNGYTQVGSYNSQYGGTIGQYITQPYSNPCELVSEGIIDQYRNSLGLPEKIKVTVNLRRKDGLGDNVLLSYNYNVQSGYSYTYSPQSCNQSFFRPATIEEISGANGVCRGTVYKTNRIQSFKNEDDKNLEMRADKPAKLNLGIYPNPASNLLSVSYDLREDAEVKSYITDMAGKVVTSVFKEKVSKGFYTLDFPLENIGNGVYMLIFEANGERLTKKVVVSK